MLARATVFTIIYYVQIVFGAMQHPWRTWCVFRMYLESNAIVNRFKNDKEGLDLIEMNNVKLPEMDCDLIPFYYIGSQKILPFWVEIEKID